MFRTIQARAVPLDRIEKQNEPRPVLVWVRNYRNPITRFVRPAIPSSSDHEADGRSLDIPRSDRGRVRRVTPNRDDDVAVRVLPPILLYNTSKRHIPGHIEHRARMMSEGERRRRGQHRSERDNQTRTCQVHPHGSFDRREQDGRSYRQKKGTIRANCGRVLKVGERYATPDLLHRLMGERQYVLF